MGPRAFRLSFAPARRLSALVGGARLWAIRWAEAITHIAVRRHPRRVLLLIKCPRCDRHRAAVCRFALARARQIVKPASFLLDVICLLHRIFLDLSSRLVKLEIYRHLRANFSLSLFSFLCLPLLSSSFLAQLLLLLLLLRLLSLYCLRKVEVYRFVFFLHILLLFFFC